MTARLFLAVLGVGLTIAQQEYLLYTNGPGGVECGKYHRCIQNATCEDVKGVHMCECPHPLLVGNAKLQCLPKGDYDVWIQNDPHLKNFHSEFAGLHTPCPYRVLNLMFVPKADTRVILELYGQNVLFRGGHYFLTKLSLSTTVYIQNDLMKQIMEFEGDVLVDTDTNSYNYTFLARSLDTSLLDEPEMQDRSMEIVDTRFSEYIMAIDKDAFNNLLHVQIPGLGVTLFFRPPSMHEEIDNIKLPMVPGAVFNIQRDSWKMVDISKSEYDIAAFPEGPSLKEQATDMKTSLPTYVQWLLLQDSLSDLGYNDTICYKTREIVNLECRTEEQKLYMLGACSAVYADKGFLECLTERNTMHEYLDMHKLFFQTCASVMCTKNTSGCEKMKREMPEVTKCPLPKKIQDIDCSTFM
ncbi:hypothetical protein ElyMa_002365600 [Elysia marginata]|uniref:VWFD domain-containing protein n=1 Tax=Elysia marginata TaxID=1093978 RepID=A0AAV4GBQ1_9GAST|nr:hypothetical protein ElyMa_002365600 [Elysia marginata]